MGLHWATEFDRPLPLAAVDGLRSRGRRAVRSGRLLVLTQRAAAQTGRHPRLTLRSSTVGVPRLHIAR